MVEIEGPEIERVFREEYGRAVAVLIRAFGDIDIAEETVQDAFTVAAQRWPDTGLPPSPAGWIITTAKNRAIDRLRRHVCSEGVWEEYGYVDGNQRSAASVREVVANPQIYAAGPSGGLP